MMQTGAGVLPQNGGMLLIDGARRGLERAGRLGAGQPHRVDGRGRWSGRLHDQRMQRGGCSRRDFGGIGLHGEDAQLVDEALRRQIVAATGEDEDRDESAHAKGVCQNDARMPSDGRIGNPVTAVRF